MIFENYRNAICLSVFVLLFYSCIAFKHGATSKEAEDTYYLVTGNKEYLGDKRFSYIENLYRCSPSTNFFCNNYDGKGRPDFIYEYMANTKRRGIEMFFVKFDSVYVFEETKKPFDYKLKEIRKINDEENLIYQKLNELKKI